MAAAQAATTTPAVSLQAIQNLPATETSSISQTQTKTIEPPAIISAKAVYQPTKPTVMFASFILLGTQVLVL
jgi:hypothetical protein